MVVCLERGADLHMAQLMPLALTVSCSSKIQIGFTFLLPAYPGCPGKEAVKWLCCSKDFLCRPLQQNCEMSYCEMQKKFQLVSIRTSWLTVIACLSVIRCTCSLGVYVHNRQWAGWSLLLCSLYGTPATSGYFGSCIALL